MSRLVLLRGGPLTRSFVTRAGMLRGKPHLGYHHSPTSAKRSFSATVADSSSGDNSARDRRISRTLYRQLLRWCDSVKRDGFPDDIVKHFVPPQNLSAPDEVDPFRMELLHEAAIAGQADDDPSNSQSEDAAIVRRALRLLPKKSEYSRTHVTVPIHSVKDLGNAVRAVFRLNNVAVPDASGDRVASEALRDHQKKRRNAAFETLKTLNELYSEKLQAIRKLRARHADRQHVAFVVGQVVQHRHERWRGVVAAWDKQQQPARMSASDGDFSKTSSLTSKDYVRPPTPTTANYAPNAVVRYNVLLDAGDAYNLASLTGWATTDQSDLVAVTDRHLCRIRNNFSRDYFTGYSSATGRFVPNSLKAFEYPSDVQSDDNVSSSSSSSSSQPSVIAAETQQRLCEDVIEGVQTFAAHLESLLLEIASSAAASPKVQSSQPFATVRGELQELARGNVVPSSRHRFDDDLAVATVAALHLRVLLTLSHSVLETMLQHRIAVKERDKLRFAVGDVVQHKKYGFRGVVVAWDPVPTVNVTRWDGLRDIPNAMQLPFYQVIPDQQDCIEAFGGERPLRYVCEANLEPCPRDRILLDVDLEPGWERQDGSYRAPALVRFKYGADLDDGGVFERCMEKLEEEINEWQYRARNPSVEDETIRKISLANMMRLLQVVDNMDDASAVQDTIKEMRKAHSDKSVRSRLELGITALVAGNAKSARDIYLAVVQADPDYAEGWNKLATCEFMMGKHEEAVASTFRVLDLEPMHYQAKNGLGLLHFEKKEYREAAACFRESLEMDPWSPVAAKLSVCVDLLDHVILEDELPF